MFLCYVANNSLQQRRKKSCTWVVIRNIPNMTRTVLCVMRNLSESFMKIYSYVFHNVVNMQSDKQADMKI